MILLHLSCLGRTPRRSPQVFGVELGTKSEKEAPTHRSSCFNASRCVGASCTDSIYIDIYIYIYMHIYTYIYIHIHIYTYIYIYTCMYTLHKYIYIHVVMYMYFVYERNFVNFHV